MKRLGFQVVAAVVAVTAGVSPEQRTASFAFGPAEQQLWTPKQQQQQQDQREDEQLELHRHDLYHEGDRQIVLLRDGHTKRENIKKTSEASSRAQSAQQQTTTLVSNMLVILLCLLSAVLGAAVVGIIYYFRRRSTTQGQDDTVIASDQDLPKIDQAFSPIVQPDDALYLLSKHVAQFYGPKFTKTEGMHDRIRDHVNDLKTKTKSFVLSELNVTAGAVLEAIDAEEATSVLDWNSKFAQYFPPAPTLLNGLISSPLLVLSHWMQAVHIVYFVPVSVLCLVAIVVDWHSVCGGIPFLYVWAYSHAVVGCCLVLAHFILCRKIRQVREALYSHAATMESSFENLTNTHEMIGFYSVMLQRAVLAKEELRACVWSEVVGIGNTMWLLMTVWTAVLAVGWTTVPGVVAMYPRARDFVQPEEFCGAIATVAVLRCTAVWSSFFFMFNVVVCGQWVSGKIVNLKICSDAMLRSAKTVDETMLGIPVVQTAVKSSLSCDHSDLSYAKLIVALDEKASLEKERANARKKLTDLDQRLASVQAESKDVIDVGSRGRRATVTADLEKGIEEAESFAHLNLDALRTRCSKIIDETESKSLGLTGEERTDKIEALMRRVQEVADQIKGSDMMQDALSRVCSVQDSVTVAAGQRGDQIAQLITQSDIMRLAATSTRDLAEKATDAARKHSSFMQ